MSKDETIDFSLSISDVDAIDSADKSTAKLSTDSVASASKGEYSPWNCPYETCYSRVE